MKKSFGDKKTLKDFFCAINLFGQIVQTGKGEKHECVKTGTAGWKVVWKSE